MAKIKDIKELRKFFLELEQKYDLLNFEIDGVKPWQLKRVKLDYDFGKLLGIMSVPHSATSLKDKILNIFAILKSAIFNNPFLSKQTDIIIFSHARVKKVNNEYIDVYTHYFIEKLQKEDRNFIEIENLYLGKHYKTKEPWRYHSDLILIVLKLFSRFVEINNFNSKIIDKVEKEIEEKIGYYDLKSLFVSTTKMYKIEYKYYYKLFKKLKPKQIYLVVSYSGLGSMIKAAKDLGIETIELQHGNFSKYHYGYYFGEEKRDLDYFPDKFYVWNEYWKKHINFPIDDKNIIIKQFDYLKYRQSFYSDVNKIPNQAVVLSQGVLGDRIAKHILDNWDYFKKFKIVYKLHPGEYNRYKEYKYLMQLEQKYNIKIVTDIDLYNLFAQSEYQIGIFSTALYEGVEFGCKSILLDLAGVEEMYSFKDIYKVEMI